MAGCPRAADRQYLVCQVSDEADANVTGKPPPGPSAAKRSRSAAARPSSARAAGFDGDANEKDLVGRLVRLGNDFRVVGVGNDLEETDAPALAPLGDEIAKGANSRDQIVSPLYADVRIGHTAPRWLAREQALHGELDLHGLGDGLLAQVHARRKIETANSIKNQAPRAPQEAD